MADLAPPGGLLRERKFDVAIVGAGVLGTCLAFWISELFDCSIALIDMENKVATHTSARNTGIVHRPFYMDPGKKRRFAMAANRSFGMWQKLANEYSLPWRRTGIIEVAIEEGSLPILQDYLTWGTANGMAKNEIEFVEPFEM